MNKNVKRTIAMTLAIGAFTAVGQSKYPNLFAIEANASSSDADELTSLDLQTSDGDSIDLYEDSSYDDELSDDLSVGETYYAKTSSSKVVIDSIDGADDDNVRIFKGSSSTAYEVGDDISISQGTTTTLKVRVYEDEYDEDEDYSSSDYNQYTIIVKSTEDSEDDVDLLGIKLNNGFINFNPNTTSYDVNVASNASSVTVQAMPKDEDYTVTIDGTTVDEDDYYQKTVDLSTDSDTDTIEVEVSNDDDTKTYTLNITKTETTGLGQQGMNSNQLGKGNGLANQNGNGNGFGNQNGNGNGNQGLHNGWSNDNGSWYYYDTTGSKKTGWQQDGGSWYYLNNEGKMQTGWVKDTDGSWYYLQQSGAMAKNTTIDGYKLGANGTWIR